MESIKDIHVIPNTQQITHNGGALALNLSKYDCFIITLNADLDSLSLSGTVTIGEDYKIVFIQGSTLRTVTLPSTIITRGDTLDTINQINTKTSIRFSGISSTEILQDGYISTSASINLVKASVLESETGTDDTKYLTSNTGYQGWLSWAVNKTVSALDTISKNVVGAINELNSLVSSNIGVLYVSATNGSDVTGDGRESKPFATLEAAHDAASDGDTIILAQGTYNDTFTLTKKLTIKSVITGPNNGDGYGAVPNTLIANVTIQQNNSTGTTSGCIFENLIISNCTVSPAIVSPANALEYNFINCQISSSLSIPSGLTTSVIYYMYNCSLTYLFGENVFSIYIDNSIVPDISQFSIKGNTTVYVSNSTIKRLNAIADGATVYLYGTSVIVDNHTGSGLGTLIDLNPWANIPQAASQAEAEAGTEDIKFLTPSKGYLGWLSWVQNKDVSSLNTTSKTVVGAINELKSDFGVEVEVISSGGLLTFTEGIARFQIDNDLNITSITGVDKVAILVVEGPGKVKFTGCANVQYEGEFQTKGGYQLIRILNIQSSSDPNPIYFLMDMEGIAVVSTTISPPTNVVATASAADTIGVTWTAPTTGTPTSYQVERNLNGTGWAVLVADTQSTSTSYNDDTLSTGDYAQYRIAGRDENGVGQVSAASNTATTWTVPDVPTGQTATLDANNIDINVSWSAAANNGGASITSTEIYRSTDGGAYALVGSVGNGVEVYKDENPGRGSTFTYQIRHVNAVGNGAFTSATSGISPTYEEYGNNTIFDVVAGIITRRADKTIIEAGTSIESIAMYIDVDTASNGYFGIYSDNAGVPDTLLGATASFALGVGAAQWIQQDLIAPVEIASQQTVWLAWVFEGSTDDVNTYYTDSAPGEGRAWASTDNTYASGMPASFGSLGASGDYNYSIYAIGTATSGSQPTAASFDEISANWNGAGQAAYVYTPEGYADNSDDYPLLIFSAGAGERGSDTAGYLSVGLPGLLNAGTITPDGMLIGCLMEPEGPTVAANILSMITYLNGQGYRIDTNRIYMTGLSWGGSACSIVMDADGDATFAAMIPVSGDDVGTLDYSTVTDIAFWAFHGDSDTIVGAANSHLMFRGFAAQTCKYPPRISDYLGFAHNDTFWSGKVYNSNTADYNIYKWLLRHSKDADQNAIGHVDYAEYTESIDDYWEAYNVVEALTAGAVKTAQQARLATILSTINAIGTRVRVICGTPSEQVSGNVNNLTTHTIHTISNLVAENDGSNTGWTFSLINNWSKVTDSTNNSTRNSNGTNTIFQHDFRGKGINYYNAYLETGLNASGLGAKFGSLPAGTYKLEVMPIMDYTAYQYDCALNMTVGAVTKSMRSIDQVARHMVFTGLSPSGVNEIVMSVSSIDRFAGVAEFRLTKTA